MSVDPKPTLHVRDSDVFLGEEIIFRRGLRCPSRIPAHELERSGRLVVRGPDGQRRVYEREPGTYDGPSMIDSIQYLECLNDLAAPLAPGAYELAFEVDAREARACIDLKVHPTGGPTFSVDFPERIQVEPGKPFAVRVALANLSPAPLRFVEPDSCYAASVVGFVSADDPPSWMRLTCTAGRERTQTLRYRTPIDVRNLDELATVDLAPGDRRSYQVVFDEAVSERLGPQWFPRERFGVTVGLVAHVFDPHMARPIRWLRRATGEYLMTGARVSVGEARCKPWEWAHLSSSGA